MANGLSWPEGPGCSEGKCINGRKEQESGNMKSSVLTLYLKKKEGTGVAVILEESWQKNTLSDSMVPA